MIFVCSDMKRILILISSNVLIFSLLYLCACTKKSSNYTGMTETAPHDSSAKKKYLALGDSYTIGQNVEANERFPFLTVALLQQHQLFFSDPQYIATTGWTTINLQNAIKAQALNPQYDVVSLLIGVNDQYQGLDTAGYRLHFTQLLTKSISLAGNRAGRVFVLSIPDYSATPFVPAPEKARVSREIDGFNAINKEISLQYNVTYIDITPSTRLAYNDATLLASDGLHYSAKEHQKWAELLAAAIEKALK